MEIVIFDLTKRKPAYIALGIRYPENVNLKEASEKNDSNDWYMGGNIIIKIFKNDQMINEETIDKFDRHNSASDGYRTSDFYRFIWSSPVGIFKQPGNSRVEINCKNLFACYEIMMSDAGLD